MKMIMICSKTIILPVFTVHQRCSLSFNILVLLSFLMIDRKVLNMFIDFFFRRAKSLSDLRKLKGILKASVLGSLMMKSLIGLGKVDVLQKSKLGALCLAMMRVCIFLFIFLKNFFFISFTIFK